MNNIIDEKSRRTQVLSGPTQAQARSILQNIYDVAIEAVKPGLLLRNQLTISGSALFVESRRERRRFPLTGRVFVVGVGKGVDLTAPVWEELFGDRLEQGILLSRDRSSRSRTERLLVATGGHPLPDGRGLKATERCLQMLRAAGSGDCVIFFLTGGASSLLVQPAPGLTLDDKRRATDLLLRSGMTIAQINCVRKHLSKVKAGGILRYAYPARVLTLAISDVIGDDPAVIGSAPTFADPTTYRDAWRLLRRYHLLEATPPRLKNHLLQGSRGKIPETLKPPSALATRSHFVLLASNREALAAARDKAEALGFSVTVLTSELSGDTATRARELCSLLKGIKGGDRRHRRPHCFLLGGETTVQVRGKGTGGRNLEFALVSALELAGCRGLYMLSAGTDGSDGPTPAAGAFADGATISEARALGLDPRQALSDNDSYNFFKRLGHLFCPGPTGTNVLDLKIVLVY